MMRRVLGLAGAFAAALVVFAGSGGAQGAQGGAQGDPAGLFADGREARELRRSLVEARTAATAARTRAQALEQQAQAATQATDKARLELAGLAARLQDAEAQAGLAQARLAVVEAQRGRINARLAARRAPLAQLTAALQRVAGRPVALSVLQPASLRETVYLRAVLNSAVPAIQARTAALRGDLARSRRLAGQARAAVQVLRTEERAIALRRTELLAQAARHRQTAQRATGAAQREALRSVDLALEARDLDDLVREFDRMATVRAALAALPGPMMRPRGADGTTGAPVSPAPLPTRPAAGPPAGYRLPVIGRVTGGFGDSAPDGTPRTGVTLAPRPAALVVAPASGRIAFAGPYRGFGNIVIIEHPAGWTSLVTGLGALQGRVGDRVTAGSPLGTAPATRPEITLELRRAGTPRDPLPLALGNG